MPFIKVKHILVLLIGVFVCHVATAQNESFEKHINVAMRLIGHEVLLDANDSTSIILPIKNKDNDYTINFSNDFDFTTDKLIKTIDSILLHSKIAKHYIVEVSAIDSVQVVYSYEYDNVNLPVEMDLIDMNESSAMVPCRGRVYPKDSYEINISILEYFDTTGFENGVSSNKVYTSSTGEMSYGWAFALVGIILIMITFFLYYKEREEVVVLDSNILRIGGHLFDIRNTALTYNDSKIELTHKESELLLLLHKSVNNTVEKEVMLKEVWGDEGDYVGRTLDVFISKLRKKLESDPLVKIINVRGVGYKLIVNE